MPNEGRAGGGGQGRGEEHLRVPYFLCYEGCRSRVARRAGGGENGSGGGEDAPP